MMLSLGLKPLEWTPPVLKTVATTDAGVPELLDAIARHWQFVQAEGRLERLSREHGLRDVLELATIALSERLQSSLSESAAADLAGRVARRETDPYTEARALADRLLRGIPERGSGLCEPRKGRRGR